MLQPRQLEASSSFVPLSSMMMSSRPKKARGGREEGSRTQGGRRSRRWGTGEGGEDTVDVPFFPASSSSFLSSLDAMPPTPTAVDRESRSFRRYCLPSQRRRRLLAGGWGRDVVVIVVAAVKLRE
jgi:hypothetical protein